MLAGKGIEILEGKRKDRKVLEDIKKYQNTYKSMKWGSARIIQSEELLVIEKALEIAMDDYMISKRCYEIARDYCETYNSKYGTGLTPDSLSRLREVYQFWKHESNRVDCVVEVRGYDNKNKL